MQHEDGDRNEVLSSVILLERLMPRVNVSTRTPIRRSMLISISETLGNILTFLMNRCDDPLVLTPIIEVIELINNVSKDDGFVETDAETKSIIAERLSSALWYLYLFAGKYYVDNSFTWVLGRGDVLRHIVDACIEHGYYFGYDKEYTGV